MIVDMKKVLVSVTNSTVEKFGNSHSGKLLYFKIWGIQYYAINVDLVNPSFMHAFTSGNTQESCEMSTISFQIKILGIRPSRKLPRSYSKQLVASGFQLRSAQSHRAITALCYR